jgi:hypothetical protein
LGASDPIFNLGRCLPIGPELGNVWHEERLGFGKIHGSPKSPSEYTTEWSCGIYQIIKKRERKKEIKLVHGVLDTGKYR